MGRNIREANLDSMKEELPDGVYQRRLGSVLSCGAMLTPNLISICGRHRDIGL